MSIKAYFSPSTKGIYSDDVYKQFPNDSVLIPNDLYVKFRQGEILGFSVIDGEIVPLDAELFITDPRELMNVTAFQAHAAIARAGLYEQVDALMSDPDTPLETRLAWQKAQTFKRLSPTVLTLGATLGLTDQQLDDLFTLAATIDA